MAGEEPMILPVGTEVSAKYRGAFCEAKVKKIVKCVKCKVTLAEPRSQIVVLDEDVKGTLKTGSKVEIKHPDTGLYVDATFNKLTDCSMYTVVFDDGDENTLRRTQLCLKGEKHFVKSETLDQLPLTHPEHFGTPVMKGYKGTKRRRSNIGNAGMSDSESESEASECSSPRKRIYKGRLQDLIGRVLCMEIDDRKKTTWVPVLVIIPSASDMELKTRDHLLVKSFKDSRFHSVSRKDTKEFTRDMAIKNEDKSLKPALEKALSYYDTRDLPSNWDREELLGLDSEEEDESDTSDDEPSEEKDHFVAQLYKFMDDRDTPINKAPAIGSRDLNLYRLFKLVRNLGGYNKVTNLMKWKMVYSKMNLPPSGNAYNQIKTAYKKFLHAYEDFYRKLGSTMGNRPGRTRHSSGRSLLSFREREAGQPKSPRAEKKKEDKPEEDKNEEEKKNEDKKDEDKGKGKETEKKDTEAKGKKTEDRKTVAKEEPDVDTDSPRKRRSRAAGEKKVEEKPKEEEKTTKRVTREDAAKMKDEVKDKKEEERSRRSASKKTDDNDEKEEATQKRRSTPARKKTGKVEEKEDPKKKVQEEPISDGGPDEDSDDGEDDEEPPPPPPKEEGRKDRKKELSLGTKLKVRYGRGRNQKIYEAKVVEAEQESGSTHYLVHYAGWNTRYDEWVQRDRIVSIVSEGTESDKKAAVAKKLISPKVGGLKKTKRPQGSPPAPQQKNEKCEKTTKSKPQTPPPTSQKARPTRSSGQDVTSTPPSVLPTRRSRRGSGVGDNASDLQSHVSESESDDESVSDDKKGDTDDTDSVKTKPDKTTEPTKPKSQPRAKGAALKKEKDMPVSDSEAESVDSLGRDVYKGKVKSEGKGTLKVKGEIKCEPSPAGTEKSDGEEPMQVDSVKKTPGKSTPTRPTKGVAVKSEEASPVPCTPSVNLTCEESMDMEDTPENKAKELLAKDEDAQSDDDILKDLKVNHHIDMGDILIYPDEMPPIAPPKPKGFKDSSRGKRRKSTDSVDEVSRQDSLDTVAYGYDIQDAVQNILDQLDVGDDDSDDLSFLTPTKEPKEIFPPEESKKDDGKSETPKKEKKGDKEKVKGKGEKPKTKGAKKAEKTTSDDAKPESDTEKEKKHDGEKKKIKKKKKVKKKVEGKDVEKEAESASAVAIENDLKPIVDKTEPVSVPALAPVAALALEEIISPPKLAAVTPTKDKEDLTRGESLGLEPSPLPPKLQAERMDIQQPSDKLEEERPAPSIDILPATVPELTIAKEPVPPTQPQPAKQQTPSQQEPLPSVSSLPSLPSTSVPSSSVPLSEVKPVESSAPPTQPTPSTAPTLPASTSKPPPAPVELPPTAPLPSDQPSTTLFDNTPPETPEGSPVPPQAMDIEARSPPRTAEPPTTVTSASAHVLPTTSSTTADSDRVKPELPEPCSVTLPIGGESPNACDTSTISNGSDGSSGNMPSSEDSTEGSSTATHSGSAKRKLAVDDPQQPAKKRKRGPKRGVNADKGKSTPKHTMSDSDDAAEAGSVSPKPHEPQPMTPVSAKNTPNKGKVTVPSSQSPSGSGMSGGSPGREDPRPPRPSKYNFNLEEGNYLEGEHRITFIMEKLTEIRKIYMSLKAEVACIDRRRKRAKRREKEGTALALASLANS